MLPSIPKHGAEEPGRRAGRIQRGSSLAAGKETLPTSFHAVQPPNYSPRVEILAQIIGKCLNIYPGGAHRLRNGTGSEAP